LPNRQAPARPAKETKWFGMSEFRIIPYDEAYRDDVLAITIAAWTPVFKKTASEVPRFVYDCFYPSGWKVRQEQEVRSLLESEPESIWLALAGDKPAGFVGIRLHPEDLMGEIHILAVSPLFQRRGIGRRLMVHAENLIRASGMKIVMVETVADSGHEPARRKYEAAGYVQWPVARYFKSLE